MSEKKTKTIPSVHFAVPASRACHLFLWLAGLLPAMLYYRGKRPKRKKFTYTYIINMYQDIRYDLFQSNPWTIRLFISWLYAAGIAAYRMDSIWKGVRYLFSYKNRRINLGTSISNLAFPENGAKLYFHQEGTTKSAQPAVHIPDIDGSFRPLPPCAPYKPLLPPEATDIIIPVWNGFKHLKKLLPSLFAHTTAPHRFIFINDCSTDANVLPWLNQQCSDRSDCIIINNKQNLGFPATVNKGAAICQGNFVILNTDTEVPAHWLERLIAPLYEKDSKVASVTPFSCAATTYSFPTMYADENNKILLQDYGLTTIDRLFSELHIGENDDLSGITGVGFCMAINSKAWRKIGGFNAELFGKGYGEEVDWCQRCREAGWQNRLQPRLYVAHHHGGSFDNETKRKLLQTSCKLLAQLHPHYFLDEGLFVKRHPWRYYRATVLWRLLMESPLHRILYLHFTEKDIPTPYLHHRIEQDLAKGSCVLVLSASESMPNCFRLTVSHLHSVSIFDPLSPECITHFINNIGQITVNSLQKWTIGDSSMSALQWICALKKRFDCKLEYVFHDFHPLFQTAHQPSLEGINQPSEGLSKEFISPISSKQDSAYQAWQTFFNQCHTIRFFTPGAYKRVADIFSLSPEQLQITPPSALFESAPPYHFIPATTELRIAVCTDRLTATAGKGLLPSIAKQLQLSQPKAKLLIIGPYSGKLSRNMEIVCTNNLSALCSTLLSHQVTLCLHLPLWPEAFSPILAALMAINAPIIAFKTDAYDSQLHGYPMAQTIPPTDVQTLIRAILDMYARLKKQAGPKRA